MHNSYDPNREIKKAAEAVILARWDLIRALVDRTEQEHIVSKVIYMKFLARCGEKELQKRKLQLRNAGLEMKMKRLTRVKSAGRFRLQQSRRKQTFV